MARPTHLPHAATIVYLLVGTSLLACHPKVPAAQIADTENAEGTSTIGTSSPRVLVESYLNELQATGRLGADYLVSDSSCNIRTDDIYKCMLFIISPHAADPRSFRAGAVVLLTIRKGIIEADEILSNCDSEEKNCHVLVTGHESLALASERCDENGVEFEIMKLGVQAESGRFNWLIGNNNAPHATVDAITGDVVCLTQD